MPGSDEPGWSPAPVGDATITVVDAGGFVPIEHSFANQPSVAIYLDGTVLQPGVIPAIYPGPALWPLQRSVLPAGAVDDLVQMIRDAKVLGADFGQPGVADASTVTLTLTVDGRTEQASAYALGLDDDPQLSKDQRALRTQLQELVNELTNPKDAASSDAYKPTALSVLVRAADPATTDPEVKPNELDWPLGDLAKGGVDAYGARCLAVTGADTDKVLDVVNDATAITLWNSSGTQWNLSFKAALPGETPCATDS